MTKIFKALPCFVLANLLSVGAHARLSSAKNVVDFQPNKSETSVTFPSSSGSAATARLINLNQGIGTWFLLGVKWSPEVQEKFYHIENWQTGIVTVNLTTDGVNGNWGSQRYECKLFDDNSSDSIKAADKKGEVEKRPYVEICSGKLRLRRTGNPAFAGAQEWGANFLRNNLGSFGESIVDTYKEHKDNQGESGQIVRGGGTAANVAGAPAEAQVSDRYKNVKIRVPQLDIALRQGSADVNPGAWYPIKNQENIYFSAMKPAWVHESLLSSHSSRVRPFDGTEEGALDYLVAFDLNHFNVGWSHGARLPGVGWSKRNDHSTATGLAGPDGFATTSPLAMSGALSNVHFTRLAATMCGGFQRHHSAFKMGEFSQKNYGSYYGFLQEGVVLSNLNPGLATFIIYNNGAVEMKTWEEEDYKNIPTIRYARQNGVPLIEPDQNGQGIPGRLVGDWGGGNWSGTGEVTNKEGEVVRAGGLLRSQRAGACLLESQGRSYLVYGYFSAATPSAMARVFQSYGCKYAIHLDMNSAGQGYLGLFSGEGNAKFTEHPVKEMAGRDTKISIGGQIVPAPRFVGKPDEADFFYILRKK